MYSCISVHIIHVYNSRKQFQSYICRTQLLCDARNAIWHLETVERCLRGTRKERVNLVATVWRYFSQRWLEPETLWAAKGIARIRDNLEIFLGVCNGEIELLRRGKYITGQKKILVVRFWEIDSLTARSRTQNLIWMLLNITYTTRGIFTQCIY